VSQWFDVQFYDFLKRKNNPLWIRNNGSTIVSQLIDTLIFVPIAFVGLYEVSVLLEIALTTYFIKVLVAFLDTPFLYLMKRITPRD